MKYDDFMGQVQSKAQMGSTEEAVKAVRATLSVLGKRMTPDQRKNLSSQLPSEMAHYLEEVSESERFDLEEFFEKVGTVEETDLPRAVYHARVVIDVLGDAVTEGMMNKIKSRLPEDYGPLFESGSEGKM